MMLFARVVGGVGRLLEDALMQERGLNVFHLPLADPCCRNVKQELLAEVI